MAKFSTTRRILFPFKPSAEPLLEENEEEFAKVPSSEDLTTDLDNDF
jgi:hypothetical protein